MKAVFDTGLDSVRNGQLWNVTRNLLRTTSPTFLSPKRQKQRCLAPSYNCRY